MANFDAERFRDMHRRRGEPYRWQKALRGDNYNPTTGHYERGRGQGEKSGRVYVEQEVDAAWRALVHDTVDEIEDPDFGLINTGHANISVMPDETPLIRLDRIILTARQMPAREMAVRASGSQYDTLSREPAAITAVNQGEQIFEIGVDCELADDGRLHWLGGDEPGSGASFSVEYAFHPVYLYLGSGNKLPRIDKNGVLMPQRGIMVLEQNIKRA